jgi:class 3 adenylate cyclase/tetratricopeptide (TPR) repeat protein
MNCSRCQHANLPGQKFCRECGARLSSVCGACGAAHAPGQKFCGECGTPLAPSQSALRFGSPQSYTPKHLAEKILTSKSALEGERKQVTVLFADLKGSMEMLADRDPEEARTLLDPVLDRMMEAVHRYEGTVNQVMGDGIMALFGAPLALEDHAVRACYAALRMQETIRLYSDDLRRVHGLEVQVRVGLNSGEVVVRAIGSDLHMDYTAVGQTVHLAARMEQLAAPGSSRITGDTLRLVEGYVAVKPLGPVPVKGLGAAVEVYELVGMGMARTRLHAAARRGLTRFVGRDTELDQLRAALDKASHGHGQVVGVLGEAGVGKSRLFWELTRSHRVQGWLTLETSSASWGQATAYLSVIHLLRAYFQIESDDDPRRIREKVTGRVLTLDRALGPAVPVLLALLDVPVDEPGWQELDPPQRRQRTLEAVRRLLLRESQVQPLLLVFEDLHWVDGESQAVLDSLVEGLPATRTLLLVNYRPEYQYHWSAKSYSSQLRLDPLPAESAGTLLDAVLGDDIALGPLKRLMIERTEGNPFFLEECIRTLAETGILVEERGAYRATGPLDGIQVPATVQTILAARIDRLPAEEKGLLQTAAVIGERVPYALLEAVASVPDDRLRPALAHLQSAEFLYEASLFPDLEYTFKHALTHEVAYTSLLQERRRGLHARIMTAIEALAEDRRSEHVDRLAHHAFRGEVWDKAVRYLRRAGSKATARSAYREAMDCFEQALEALGHLAHDRDTRALAIDLRLDLRTALTPLGHYRKILELLREAESLARELGDERRLGHVVADMSARLKNTGDHAGALAAGRRACAIAANLHDRDLQFEATYRLAQAHFAVGDFVRSVELLRQTVGALGGGPMPPDSRLPRYLAAFDLLAVGAVFDYPDSRLPRYLAAWPRAWLALGLATLGQFSEAISYGEESIRIAESANHPHSIIEARAALGRVYLARGDLEKSIALFEQGLAPSRAWNMSDSSVFSGLGYAYAVVGRVDQGLLLLEEAVERGDSIDSMGMGHAMRLSRLSEGYLLAGRVAAARERAHQALELSRTQKERGNEAYALRLCGELASQGEQPEIEAAERYLRQAIALATDLGMRPLVAHCHLGLGKLDRHTGKRDAAQAHLTTAIAMYQEMDMRFWLQTAEGELRGGGHPVTTA